MKNFKTILLSDTNYFTLLLILLFPFFSYSLQNQDKQLFTEYKGIVEDADSGKELLFVDITIKETNISTISNSEGEFSIKIPKENEDGILIISHLGYQDLIFPISKLNEDRETYIKLKLQVTELSAVSIHTIKDAKSLVKAMLNKKGDNYSNNQNVMTAFYRETIKKRRRNASLSEAVVEIFKQPYTSAENDLVSLVKARKSVNYSRLDTLAMKLQGGPFSTLYTDLIKYQEFIFTAEDLDDYNFTFGNVSKVNNRDVYVINFKQIEKIKTPLYYGKLYVDAESLALTSATYNLNVENRKLASEIFVRKKPRKAKVYPTKASYRVDYRVKNGLWYYGYSNVALTFKVNWENKLFNNVYTLNSEMAVTDWKRNSTAQTPKNSINPTVILSEKASGFSDPKFWGQYNIIEPEKSIESAIKKINKKMKKSS